MFIENYAKTMNARRVGIALAVLVCCMATIPCQAQAKEITANDPLPTKILTCGGSVIRLMGPRLEGDTLSASSGYTVLFKNGGGSIDYETPKSVLSSKVGDHVLMCLVYIPKHCPPGDNRGRVYTVTNLRTLHSWSASSDEHTCGGA